MQPQEQAEGCQLEAIDAKRGFELLTRLLILAMKPKHPTVCVGSACVFGDSQHTAATDYQQPQLLFHLWLLLKTVIVSHSC